MSLDRKDLKIQALKERVSTLTTDYEDKVADLRVELTVTTIELNERLADLQSRYDELVEKQKQEGENVPQEEEADAS